MRSIFALAVLLWLASPLLAQDKLPDPPVNAFYELNSDGTGWKRLFRVTDYYPVNSPRVTADGQFLAYDGWNIRKGQNPLNAVVITSRMDGTDVRQICTGSMPSWRPDGKRLACSRYGSDQGVWVMDADGNSASLIDPDGWGIQWSPDGRWLAYTKGRQVIVRDAANGEQHEVFPREGAPYAQIYWNMAWSKDSRQLAMIAELGEKGRELAIVDSSGAEFGFRRQSVGQFNPMLSWSPDSTRLVFPERIGGKIALREIDPARQGSLKSVPGIPEKTRIASACWLPDGSKLIVLVIEN